MYVLDTNTVSLLLIHPSKSPRLVERIRQVPQERLFITLEEILRGALSEIRKEQQTPRLVARYAFFQRLYHALGAFNIRPYEEAADSQYRSMPPEVRCIGSQDCRIAAIAIASGFTVVTANTRDFSRIPSVRYEDWTL